MIQEGRLALKLSPQILQSVRIMALPTAELRAKIEEELEKNPALEILKDKAVVSLNDFDARKNKGKTYFETSSDSGFIRCRNGEEQSNEHRKLIEGILSRPETLQEYLLSQLRVQPVSCKIRMIGEILIQNLSGDGFHKEDLRFLLKSTPQKEIETAANLIQTLDPQGCCTADYKESLSVQARLVFGSEAQDIEALIPYMACIERGKFTPAECALKKSESEISELFMKLKALSPFPGRQFENAGSNETRFIIPDVRVIRSEGEFKIVINNESIPVLGLTPFFVKNKNAENSAERGFIRENLKEAQSFINALNRRSRTLFRVCKAIVRMQTAFFDRGIQYLAPLSLSDIAQKLELHETTISRAANGKYMETEWGIFEIRRFFTNSISGCGSQGSHFSHEGVKEMIRTIILSEKKALTDNDITKLLAERGVKLARRTVAKYRGQLDLGSSYNR